MTNQNAPAIRSRPCRARDSELIVLGTTEAGDRYAEAVQPRGLDLDKPVPRRYDLGMDDLDCCDLNSRPCHASNSELIALGTMDAGDRNAEAVQPSLLGGLDLDGVSFSLTFNCATYNP